MSSSERRFGKWVTLDPQQTGRIIVGHEGEIITNPVKPKLEISVEYINNLLPLVVTAFPDEIEGSEGQSFLDDLSDGITRRYKVEQPEEVWKRTLAVLRRQGCDVIEITQKLLGSKNKVSERLKKAGKFGEIDDLGRGIIKRKIENKILQFWPNSGK